MFKAQKKRLEDRKSQISHLEKGIEEHEQQVKDAAQQRVPFDRSPKSSRDDGKTKTPEKALGEDVPAVKKKGTGTGKGLKKKKSKKVTAEESAGTEKPTEKPVPEPTKKPVAQSTEKPVAQSKRKSVAQSTEKPVEQSKRKSIAQSSRKSVSQPTGKRKAPEGKQKAGKISFGSVKVAKIQGREKRKISNERRHEDIILSLLEDETLDIDDDDNWENDEEDEEEGFLHIVEALHCFANTKNIFMQHLLDYSVDKKAASSSTASSTKAKAIDITFQILNFEGQLLFLVQQDKVKCTGFIVYSKKSFENILYDIHGNKVLKFIGPSVFLSRMASKMLVTDSRNRPLGYIKAFGTKVNYSVYNAIGERLFLVVSDIRIPTSQSSFTILCRGQKIGVIKTGWKNTFQDLAYLDNETAGIEFPAEMDEREKALLLGCLMLIEFFWYSPLTRLKLSLLFFGIFLILLALVILCIPFLLDSPGNDAKTTSYFVEEKLEKPKRTDTDIDSGIG